MTITPQRIKSERKRLGYTQQQIADICEISRIQWGRLERGDSVLGGRVLKAFVTAGANLNYLLTGDDSQTELMGQIMFEMALSKEEHKIVLLYRELTIEQKNLISETMKLLKNS